MSTSFKTIGLVGNTGDEKIVNTIQTLVTHLLDRGVKPMLLEHESCQIDGCERVSANQLAEQADLVVSVGGDGTMLYAAELVAKVGTPLLGINRGRLGFLADISPDEMTQSVDDILAGKFESEQRLMLTARSQGANGTVAFALNDVVLHRSGDTRLLDIEMHVDGVYLNTHGSDGLVIATPTGSTAYALSCGGPIVEPSLDAIVVVPICPHTLSERPIVLNADSRIEVRLIDRKGVVGQISCDGRPMAEVNPGDIFEVQRADFTATLLHPVGHNYYRILRSKLAWGHSSHRSR